MPSVSGVVSNVSAGAAYHIDRRRQQLQEERDILLHGTQLQRRRLLRMRPLPLPEDLEAVAVWGTAVLDVPNDASTLTHPALNNNNNRSSSSGSNNGRLQNSSRIAFDPLQHLADRYGGPRTNAEDGGEEANGNDGPDYATFMEVLCPNGTSLLEQLPISPPSFSLERHDDASPCPDVVCNRSLSPVASLEHTAAPSEHSCLVTPQNEEPSALSNKTTLLEKDGNVEQHPAADERDAVFVDAPISLHDQTQNSENAAPASPPTQRAEAADPVPQIFVSGGSFVLTPPHSSHRRLRHAKHLSSHPTPTSRRDSLLYCCGSGDQLSAYGRSGPTSPTDVSSQGLTPTSASQLPLTAAHHTHCPLGGRVLLTDRLVQSQAHTALPTMIEGFRQYVNATTAAASSSSSSSPSLISPGSCTPSSRRYHSSKQLEEERFAAVQHALAPRQNAVVLEMNNTNPEVLKCVNEARQCARPTFRFLSPEELYGCGSYRSNTFTKKN